MQSKYGDVWKYGERQFQSEIFGIRRTFCFVVMCIQCFQSCRVCSKCRFKLFPKKSNAALGVVRSGIREEFNSFVLVARTDGLAVFCLEQPIFCISPMDRFVVRKPVSSPSTGDFSSDKPPTNGNSTTTATTSRSKASTIAERKFVATAAAQAASPRDLQLMRIFQPEHGSSTTTDKSKPAAAQLSTTAPNRLNRNVVINTPQHSVANRSTTSAVAVAGRAAVDVGSGDVFTFTGRPKDVTAAADRFGNNRQSDEQENRVPNFAHNTGGSHSLVTC